MKDLLTFLRISESGKVQVIAIGKDRSREQKLYYNKSFTTDNILETYHLQPFIDEIFEQTFFRVEETIVIIPPKYYNILQNRGYIIRESLSNGINEFEKTQLKNDFYKIHAPLGMKLINVVPLHYSVDDKLNIPDPVGMFGKRFEGTFKVMFVYRNLIHTILASLDTTNIVVNKYIPENLTDAEPFLTLEEMESLYLISSFN